MVKEIPLSKGLVATVDDEDYDDLMQHKWHALTTKGLCYAVRKEGSKCILMHRQILDAPKGKVTDHIDGDGLNNRRSNLRLGSHKQNIWNCKRRATNTSGYIGVYWHKRDRKWMARIKVEGITRYLGSFDDPVEAAKTYDKVAHDLRGSFARINFPVGGAA